MLREYYENQISNIQHEIDTIESNIADFQRKMKSDLIQSGISFSPREHGNVDTEKEKNSLELIRLEEKIRLAQIRRDDLVYEQSILKEKLENDIIPDSDIMDEDSYEEEEDSNSSNIDKDFLEGELVKINNAITMFTSNRNKAKALLKEIKEDLNRKLQEYE